MDLLYFVKRLALKVSMPTSCPLKEGSNMN